MELELLKMLMQFAPAIAVIVTYHKYVLSPRDEREQRERTARDEREQKERATREAEMRAEREYFLALLEKREQQHGEDTTRLIDSHETRMDKLAGTLDEMTELLRQHNGKVERNHQEMLRAEARM